MQGFVKISKYAGMREDLVQAGGGNSSFKIDNNKMAIKASGVQLAEITTELGYAFVDASKIKEAFLNANDLNKLTDTDGKKILEEAFIEGKNPSIETFLHAISGTYTLHTHPIVVNALTCRMSWKEELKKLFPNALYVPYATPGVELAKKFFKAYKTYGIEKTPGIVFLQNHGLVVSAEFADEVILKTEEVVLKLEEYLGCNYDGYHNLTKLWKLFPEKIVWKITDKNIIDILEADDIIWPHVFCPDCVVFLGKKALILPDSYLQDDLMEFIENYGEPVMILWKKTLYIVADNVKKALEIQSVMSFSAQVMKLNNKCECSFLSDEEQNFLLNWEAEKYRRNMK